ncbi:MAG: DUF3795 domain-containing protein [Dehalococcoidia bacterium]|nr:DUF3795 domain-containing protein [Dehalococcoidia bacterium]
MAGKRAEDSKYNKKLVAVCGLFCKACSIYIGSTEEPQRLKAIAEQFGKEPEEVRCEGCRSDVRFTYCQTCKMYKCAAAKGIDFCGECESYPCEDLREFQKAMPHRIDLWKSQESIREAGPQQWYAEMIERYSCPNCGIINSTYDRNCRKCGTSPSCPYVAEHGEEIKRQLKSMQ